METSWKKECDVDINILFVYPFHIISRHTYILVWNQIINSFKSTLIIKNPTKVKNFPMFYCFVGISRSGALCLLMSFQNWRQKMNISNCLGSVPTASTIGIVLYVILYAINIATYNLVVWQTTSLQHWR